MATINTENDNFQHFSASAGDTVVFARGTSSLILSTSVATITVSFDGKPGSITLQAGTYRFPVRVDRIVIGGTGTITGAGLCS